MLFSWGSQSLLGYLLEVLRHIVDILICSWTEHSVQESDEYSNQLIIYLCNLCIYIYISTISIHTLCIVLMTLFAVNFLNVWWILGMFGSVLFPFASVRLEGNYEVFVLKYDMVTCCQGCWLESATLPHRIPLDAIRKPHIPSMLSRRSPMGMTSPGFSRSWSRSANNACRARRHCAGQCWESMTRMYIYIFLFSCVSLYTISSMIFLYSATN